MAKKCTCGCNGPVFSKGLCRRSWLMKYGKPIPKNKKPLLPKKPISTKTSPNPPKKRSPIKKVSDKMKALLAEYHRLRAIFLKAYPICEANINGVCIHKATEVHHKRGRIGWLLLAVQHWLSVCRPCHSWIEKNPKSAKERGFSEDRITSEDTGIIATGHYG